MQDNYNCRRVELPPVSIHFSPNPGGFPQERGHNAAAAEPPALPRPPGGHLCPLRKVTGPRAPAPPLPRRGRTEGAGEAGGDAGDPGGAGDAGGAGAARPPRRPGRGRPQHPAHGRHSWDWHGAGPPAPLPAAG